MLYAHNCVELYQYRRVRIKCPWFNDIRVQLNRGVGTRYILRLIRHIVSAHTLSGAVAVNINVQVWIYFDCQLPTQQGNIIMWPPQHKPPIHSILLKLRLIHHQRAHLLLIRMVFFQSDFSMQSYGLLNANNTELYFDRMQYFSSSQKLLNLSV